MSEKLPTHFIGKAYDGGIVAIATTFFREGKWTKVTVKCEDADELWQTMRLIHTQNEDFLSKVLPQGREPEATTDQVETLLTAKTLGQYIEDWLSKGNKIRRIDPAQHQRARIRTGANIDVAELLAGLDDLPSAEGREPEVPAALVGEITDLAEEEPTPTEAESLEPKEAVA